jgi:hypothetical protein
MDKTFFFAKIKFAKQPPPPLYNRLKPTPSFRQQPELWFFQIMGSHKTSARILDLCDFFN